MQLQTDRNGTALIVRLMGSLSEFGVAGDFHDKLAGEIESDIKHLIYDFNEASLPDSRFIGKMVEIYKARRDRLKMYVICDRNEEVKELMQICGLTHILTFLSSKDPIPY